MCQARSEHVWGGRGSKRLGIYRRRVEWKGTWGGFNGWLGSEPLFSSLTDQPSAFPQYRASTQTVVRDL